MDKDIPYFGINVPSDLCEQCGYQGQIDNECPNCGNHDPNKIELLRRVTGYLTGSYTKSFNKGKQAEVRDRYVHSNNLQNWKRSE